MTASGATTIGRARLSGVRSADRALATRLAVAGMLAGVDLRPPGLPPSAVLIVNRLALPVDRRLPVRPGGRLDPAWERAARDAMADLYRRAVRPLDGEVPPGCQAVLFSDEAELLACLALDISRGRAGERWWWQSYGKRWGNLTPAMVARLLADSPRSAPAALQILAGRGVVAGVIQRMSPLEARTLLRVICDAFDAPQPQLSVSPVGSRPPSPSSVPADAPSGDLIRAAAPWSRYVPAEVIFTGLSPESACLLGVALTLAQSPPTVQSAVFSRAVERWWQANQSERRGRSRSAQSAPDPLGRRDSDVVAIEPAHQSPFDTLGPSPSVEKATDRQLVQHAGSNAPTSEQLPALAETPPSAELPTFRKVGNSDASATSLPLDDNQAAARAVEPAQWLDGVTTELGGVLFLINLMQRLHLPRCFEPDWQLASQVGSWGTLELLARGLLAEELPTFLKVGNSDLRTNSLWSALAAIDGRRPGEVPNGSVTRPASLTIPAGWLRWLEPGAATIVEMPEPLDGRLVTEVKRDLRIWLAGVTPLLRAMLSRSLGEGIDPVNDLLLRRGQLYVTSSHVDLVMRLGSVAMPVRIAGLDFDPGWLPAFGRVVQFHYE